MTKVRRSKDAKPNPDHWEIHDEYRIEGKHPLIYGREFSVRRASGRHRFFRAVTNTHTGEEWIDCYDRDGHVRSFDPSRVKVVHSGTVKMRRSYDGP